MYLDTERTDRLQSVYVFYIFYCINKETLWLPIKKRLRSAACKVHYYKDLYLYLGSNIVHWYFKELSSKSLYSMKAHESEIYFSWDSIVVCLW